MLAIISMPEDMGAFDVVRLRKLVHRSDRSRLAEAFGERPFDERSWYEDGVACVGRTKVWDPVGHLRKGMSEEMKKLFPGDHWAEFEEYVARGPTVQREWVVAHETDMVNVWYRGTKNDDAAEDIADCEDMVRSIRFERPE